MNVYIAANNPRFLDIARLLPQTVIENNVQEARDVALRFQQVQKSGERRAEVSLCMCACRRGTMKKMQQEDTDAQGLP
mgnify:CR=1 FL=1